MQASDPRQRLINEQRKQIKDLTNELYKTHAHIDNLYQLQDGESCDIDSVNLPQSHQIQPKGLKSDGISFQSKYNYQPSQTVKLKGMNELDEEAIREALSSTGDKSVLIEKVVNVLKLARDVTNSNSQLRLDIMQMSNIIDDLNSELYQKQLEIDNLINGKVLYNHC